MVVLPVPSAQIAMFLMWQVLASYRGGRGGAILKPNRVVPPVLRVLRGGVWFLRRDPIRLERSHRQACAEDRHAQTHESCTCPRARTSRSRWTCRRPLSRILPDRTWPRPARDRRTSTPTTRRLAVRAAAAATAR